MKTISFSLLAFVAIILAATSPIFSPAQYSAWYMMLLWGVLSVTATIYIIKRKLYKRPAIFLIHFALLIILIGAATTHFCTQEKTIHLRLNDNEKSQDSELPFSITLSQFAIDYYQGTTTPQGYTAHVNIDDTEAIITLNNVAVHDNYRLMLKAFDSDSAGVTLSATRDPAGITITYLGYLLLLIAMIAYFFTPGTIFRRSIKQLTTMILLIVSPSLLNASPAPLPSPIVESMETLPIYYNGRITPVASFSHDIINTIHGSSTVCGMSAVEALTSMMFNFSSWADQPIIKVKNPELKKALLTDGAHYASYNRWTAAIASGLIDRDCPDYAADLSRYAAIEMIAGGQLLKLFPIKNDEDIVNWYSPADDLPLAPDNNKWLFTRKFLSYLSEPVLKHDTTTATNLIDKLRQYQLKECDGTIPSAAKLRLEVFYSFHSELLIPGIIAIIIGTIFMLQYCLRKPRPLLPTLSALGLWLWLSALIAMRWIITSTVPLANGFETMQFLAWVTLLIAIVASSRWTMAIPLSLIISGLAMIAAKAAGGGSVINPMMPVLASPLLSIHVIIIMIAYSLLAFMMLNGILGLTISRDQSSRLAAISSAILPPALFLLTAGIFIGAVWANQSWGRYWGWDPKEVWALITMIVYSFPMHPASLRWFNTPRHLHMYYIAAFISVLVTYFGANFIFSGLHSYAG